MRLTRMARLACCGVWGVAVCCAPGERARGEHPLEPAAPREASSGAAGRSVEPGSPGKLAAADLAIEPQPGGQKPAATDQRYGPADPNRWYLNALDWQDSPVDLSFLNAQDRPAGGHGILKADGDRLVFEDGTPGRFWGANLLALTLLRTPRENIAPATHRIAKLGFNLVRIHQHDADWSNQNIFVNAGKDGTRRLDPKALDDIDWWVRCLKKEGVYIWLDLIWARVLTKDDGVTFGFDEVLRNKGHVWGFNYFNDEIRGLMQEFQHTFLNHVNPYTRLAYKDDPALVGIQITNENDITHHFCNNFHTADKNPAHHEVFMKAPCLFSKEKGLPEDKLWRVWEPGPGKIFMNEMEHRFNRFMIDDLRTLGTAASSRRPAPGAIYRRSGACRR